MRRANLAPDSLEYPSARKPRGLDISYVKARETSNATESPEAAFHSVSSMRCLPKPPDGKLSSAFLSKIKNQKYRRIRRDFLEKQSKVKIDRQSTDRRREAEDEYNIAGLHIISGGSLLQQKEDALLEKQEHQLSEPSPLVSLQKL